MKKIILPLLALTMSLLGIKASAQDKEKKDSVEMLNLAGDNLDLYAVLDVFQKSKTIEEFEKNLNDEKTKLNNLDLNLDKKVDFIKVVTEKDGDSYQFILRVDVSKTESQDVAVILLDKDKKSGKVSLQIVGDEELYGKDYVIEPKGNSTVTANPGYTGDDPVTTNVSSTTSTQTTVVVQSAPVVQYVYSPAYVPYMSPYYYGYYPGWWGFATVMAVGIYRSNHWGYHGGYYGGHYHGGNNNVIINTGNRNNFNNYNNNKMRSTTVSDNRARGNYGNGAGANRRGNSASTRPSVSNNKGMSSGGNRNPSVSNRQSPSASNRTAPSTSNRSSNNFSSGSSRNNSYGGGGGGGRSMGGGSFSRGGGGGGGRRR